MKTVIERVLARDHHDEAFYQLLDGADRAELPAFLALAEHPDPLVRRDLVSLLPMLDSGSPQPASV